MVINGKHYVMPELDFNSMCRLEEMGVGLTDMDKKVLTTVRGFLALAMDGDFVQAGKELEAHLSKGGNLEQMMEEIKQAVENSGFFQGLTKKTQAGNGESQEAKTEETQNMSPSED